MSLPFTTEQFWQVMRSYNEGVWPAQLALNALYGLAIAALAGAWFALQPRLRERLA